MQVSSTTSTSYSTTTSASSSSTASLTENYQSFLTLMLKQLEVQDPTDPVDASEYTSQLVQYASLEQQIATGDKLDTISDQLSSLNFATTGVSYLGRTVEAEGDTAPLQNGAASWEYDLDSEAAAVTLTVTDSSGKTVYTTSGDTDSGTNSFSWDGTGTNGKTYTSGNYTLTVSATNSSGAAVASDIRFKGAVTAVDNTSGDTVLEAGGVSIAMDDVLAVA